MRSIVALITTLLIFNYAFANSSHREQEMSKHSFSIIQNKIEEIANRKQLHDIKIDLTIINDGSVVAIISQQEHVKEIIFTQEETTHIIKKGFTEKSLQKINSILDSFPNTREPSPRKPHS